MKVLLTLHNLSYMGIFESKSGVRFLATETGNTRGLLTHIIYGGHDDDDDRMIVIFGEVVQIRNLHDSITVVFKDFFVLVNGKSEL